MPSPEESKQTKEGISEEIAEKQRVGEEQVRAGKLKQINVILKVIKEQPELKDLKNLYDSIEAMKKHGETLEFKKEGRKIVLLAGELNTQLTEFLWKIGVSESLSAEDLSKFKKDFEILVHSEDKNIKNQELWKPIVGNILVALSVVGLFVIAIRVLSSSYVSLKEHKPLPLENSFFFTQTQSQKHISSVDSLARKGLDFKEFKNKESPSGGEEPEDTDSSPKVGK